MAFSKIAGEKVLIIKVKDTGIGIPKEKISHIFNRFYQVDGKSTRKNEGTGLGLAYTKELIQLLNGKIEVESKLNKGSCFSVYLPVLNQAAKEKSTSTDLAATLPNLMQPSIPSLTNSVSTSKETAEKIQVLVVEDNPQIVEYLKICLSSEYQITHAENGLLGMQKATETIPDIIITDVMMPEMDGIELCATLKKEEKTSHIPIIILSALAAIKNRLKGLTTGADVYLSKPFNAEELNLQLKNLLANRQKIQAYFQKNGLAQLGLLPVSMALNIDQHSQEATFLQKVQATIQEELENPDLNGDFIAHKLLLSRTQFYRKMKALINLPVSIYIRNYRLQQAKTLLKSSNEPINQIANQVGFMNPKYFSNQFSIAFGVSPSMYRKNLNDGLIV